MPMARVVPALVVGLLAAASLGPRLEPDPDLTSSSLVDRRYSCASVTATAWSPLPGLEYTGRLSVRVPAGRGSLVMVIGDDVPLDVSAESASGDPADVRIERLRSGAGTEAPPAYWLEHGNPWAAPPAIVRATVAAWPDRERVLTLRLGRRAPRVLARLRAFAAGEQAIVCAIALDAQDAFVGTPGVLITPASNAHFGAGWYGEERTADRSIVRWMREHGAVLVPSAARHAIRVRLESIAAAGANRDDLPRLTLAVNEVFRSEPSPLRPGRSSHEWVIPQRAWLAGTNELFFTVSRTVSSPGDTRPLGMALQRLILTIEPSRSTVLPANGR